MRSYYVYIMVSRSRALYTGVTRDLTKRVSGFTSTDNINRPYITKTFVTLGPRLRAKRDQGVAPLEKIAVIESKNAVWQDLSEGWYGEAGPSLRSG
jgi:hypothetical protein